MLARNEGASGPQIAEEGIVVEVLDRVRLIGPSSAGAKGSFTVYRVVEATQP
jgi:hypothetical protein